jgi:hypothetical protein
MLVCVDDIVIAGSTPAADDHLVASLSSRSRGLLQFRGHDTDSIEVCTGSSSSCEYGES